ncbi:uncharacterized protein LOC117180514 [Belonocnema kinseyi]|uniref:uncharacterized protein LOC117180514 n=1 Tax=Belonocnema kinseyi TaxID=2817044 RepID=UPI00143D2D74|nr:uncharacterized protein LOC117180514 [Belonocnema kinseyi]
MDAKKLQLVKELHKPARRNYQRRHFDIRGMDETSQADLVEMQRCERVNKGYKYILTVIDIFSTFAWAVSVNSKKGEDIAAVMEYVPDEGRVPKNLYVDKGKGFYNSQFENLIKQYKINSQNTLDSGYDLPPSGPGKMAHMCGEKNIFYHCPKDVNSSH